MSKETASRRNIDVPHPAFILLGTLKNQLPVDFLSRKTKTSFAFAHIFSHLRG